jgi:small-conductance mechanosensitive channel
MRGHSQKGLAARCSPKYVAIALIGCFVGLASGLALAQGLSPPQSPTSYVERPAQLDTVVARKAAVQTQLDAQGEPDPQKKEQEEARSLLEQILQTLSALEETLQKQATFTTQLAELPRRLQELERESAQLERSAPSKFPTVTEQLREEYQARIQATQAEIQELVQQTVAGEVRIAGIPRELEQRTRTRAQLEQEVLAARSEGTEAGEPPLSQLRMELRDLQLQLQTVQIDTLRAERDWLIRRIPLRDALLQVAQLRLAGLQQDLDSIQQALGYALQQEQAELSDTAAGIAERMEHSMDPTEALVLGISLETVEIRRATADYRQQLNELSAEVLTQEKQNAQVKQNVDRLTALVEKYASGEVPAQRLVVLFERLQRERSRYRDTPVAILQRHLRVLNEQLFALDDRLFEFDSQADSTIADLTGLLSPATAEQRASSVTEVRQLLDEQKVALRDQQQALAALVQEVTKLLALHREYKRQLDSSYFFALNKMFWLRDGEPLGWAILQETLAGALATGTRLSAFFYATQASLWANLFSFSGLRLWFIAFLMFLFLPWVAHRVHTSLRARVIFPLSEEVQREGLLAGRTAAVIILRAAIWPFYLAVVAWVYAQFLPETPEPADLALVHGLQMSALVLWVAFLGRGLLRRNGWAQQCWGLSQELCRLLRRIVMVVCIAALVCLVPRSLLLMVPGEAGTAAGSLALARFLLLVFQGVVFVVIGIAGRRGSALMQAVLSESRLRNGFLWRIWPLVHLALLGGVAAIMVLDIVGHRYAAQFVWFRTLGSLAIIAVVGLLMGGVFPWMLRKVMRSLFPFGSTETPDHTGTEAPSRSFTLLRVVGNVVLLLLAVGGILEVWGVSVSWMVTLPSVSMALTRTIIVMMIVGVTLVVLQISKALTEYLLQPRTTRYGVTREAGRKLRTLAPLVQTVIRVLAIFIATLVILEQLGIATGPVLAGVGIFGLAVGFASQSLIKDVINGLFILFEDSLSVGDVVNLRGTGGVVEKFTLRAVTLRDLSGNVHVIPNSSFDMVTNMTKDFSRYLLDVGVAYREDVDTVIRILREIDEEMRYDPEYSRDILEPLEVLGLDRFEDSAVIVRARLTTRPIQQWRVGREFNRRMKKVFDERGIEIPFPHRTLYWGVPKEQSQPPIHVAMENHKLPLLGEQGKD